MVMVLQTGSANIIAEHETLSDTLTFNIYTYALMYESVAEDFHALYILKLEENSNPQLLPGLRPDSKHYFEPGDVFETKRGGNKFEVLSREGDNLRLKLTFHPHAEGPPVHIQTGWDEKYKICSGELTLTLDGEKKNSVPVRRLPFRGEFLTSPQTQRINPWFVK